MSLCFEKARELGILLTESEQSKRLANARLAFDKDSTAQNMMQEFNDYQSNVNKNMHNNDFTQDNYMKTSKIMEEKTAQLRLNHTIKELLDSESEFYAFANQILGIIKATVTGDVDLQTSSCNGGNCSGNCGASSCK